MPPADFRDRYPNQLSGGQQQRIGVARALGGDPEVMLMDEPFGAIDPLTRDRLQNELLRLQDEVHKTIVFVTHDIDEAIKLGDRIAILREGSRIAQYDTPEQILTAPANTFVSDFIGSGASLKRLDLTRVSDITLRAWPAVRFDTDRQTALDKLRGVSESTLLVLDANGTPVRWVNADDLLRPDGRPLDQIGLPASPAVDLRATLSDALNELIAARFAVSIVVDDHGVFQGVVDIEQINEAIQEMRAAAVQQARAGLEDES